MIDLTFPCATAGCSGTVRSESGRVGALRCSCTGLGLWASCTGLSRLCTSFGGSFQGRLSALAGLVCPRGLGLRSGLLRL